MSFSIDIDSALEVTFFKVKSSPSTKPAMLFEAFVNAKPFSVKLASLDDRASLTLLEIKLLDPES